MDFQKYNIKEKKKKKQSQKLLKYIYMGVLFLPPSDAYVRSFLYLLYTLIKLYYTQKNIYIEVCFKKWFFFKVIVGYKMKIKEVIEDLKIKKKKNDSKNSKNISRTFSGVIVGSVGSVHVQIVSCSDLYFSRSIGPSYVVGTNYWVLIYCACHFQGSSLCFSFFCLLVSSV